MTESTFKCNNCECVSTNVEVKENTEQLKEVEDYNDNVVKQREKQNEEYLEALKRLNELKDKHNSTWFNRCFNRFEVESGFYGESLIRCGIIRDKKIDYIHRPRYNDYMFWSLPHTHYIRCPICNCKTEFNTCGEQ